MLTMFIVLQAQIQTYLVNPLVEHHEHKICRDLMVAYKLYI